MNPTPSLIRRLHSLRPCPPSGRVRSRLFRPGPSPAPARTGWRLTALPVGLTALCSFVLAVWSGRDVALVAGPWAWEIGAAGAGDATAVSRLEDHSRHNAAPTRLDWTNRGPSLTSMPSLPQGVTNRLR